MKENNGVLCFCGAYRGKPHQCGAGVCTGSAWAESYKNLEGEECEFCNANKNGICEVSIGIESITECQAWQEAKEGRYPSLYHPYSEGRYFRALAQEQEERYQDYNDCPF